MALANRKKFSVYREAKTRVISLVKPMAWVGSGFTIMLLLTKAKPPSFIVGLYLCLCTLFFAWREQQRVEKESEKILTISQALNNTEFSNTEKKLEAQSDLLEQIIHLKSHNQGINSLNLILANLSNAQLVGVDLNCAYLSGSNFTNANLSGASMSNGNLSGTRLSKSA